MTKYTISYRFSIITLVMCVGFIKCQTTTHKNILKYDYLPLSPEHMDFINYIKRYVYLSIANRISFIDNVENSFKQMKEDNEDLSNIINSRLSEEERQVLIREFISYARELDLPYMNENDPYRDMYGENINEFLDIFLQNLEEGVEIWPVYVFDPRDNTIHVRLNSTSDDTEIDRSSDSFPSKYEKIKQDRKRTKYKINILKNKFVSNTPNNILTELKNKMSEHHIIPYNEIVPFFDRWHAILQFDYRQKKSDNMIRISNAEYRNKLRKNIGDYLSIDSDNSVTNINQNLRNINKERSTYEKRLITWSPGNIFWGPKAKYRLDDPKSGFEVNSQLILGEYYDDYLQAYNDIVSINNELDKLIDPNFVRSTDTPRPFITEEKAKFIHEHHFELAKRVERLAGRTINTFKRTAKQKGLSTGILFDWREWNKIPGGGNSGRGFI